MSLIAGRAIARSEHSAAARRAAEQLEAWMAFDYDGGYDRDGSREEVFSRRVPAGKRTYFFDVKQTRSGEDFFITITESKRVGEESYDKHKIFLYKEDFGKFVTAMVEAVDFVREECLPDFEFRGLPELRHHPDTDGG